MRKRLKALFPSRYEWKDHWLEFLLCALSGIFGALIFPKVGMGVLAWIALTPYFFALRSLRGRSLIWGTYIFGFVWYYASLWWLNSLAVFNPFIPLGIVLLSVVQATYFLWFAFPAAYAIRRLPGWASPFILAMLWAGMEYLRCISDFAFPWNYLAHSQVTSETATSQPLFAQLSEIGGVYLVSACIVLFNAANAELVGRILLMREESKIAHLTRALPGYIAALMLLGAARYSGARLESATLAAQEAVSGENPPTLKIAVVQPNVSQLDKWNAYSGSTERERAAMSVMIRKTFQMMTAAGLQRPDLYVLPETAFPTPWFVYEVELHRTLREMADNLKGDIFFGADSREPHSRYRERVREGFREPGVDRGPTTFTMPRLTTRFENGTTVTAEEEDRMAIFNSAFLVKPGLGLVETVYNKVQLVPFGESAPIVGMIPYFQEKIMMVGSFQRGLEYTTFQTGKVRYGAMICFESAFGQLARGLALSGAQMICVLTNDAWYDPQYLIDRKGFFGRLFSIIGLRQLAASGPSQHYVHSIYRAIETRLPLVRAANTGISAFIEPSGQIKRQIEFGEQATMVESIAAPERPMTFYVRFGDWFAKLCIALLLGTIGWMWFERRRGRIH